jgi:hypothetical protein
VTPEYLESLAAALSFDRALAWRVRKEFEDHLQEAVAADPCEDRREAERRAIAKCGDPQAIAAELAVTSLARQTRRLAAAVVLALIGVLLSMKGHVAWYGAMQWPIPDDMRPVATAIGAISRYAFVAAMVLAAAGWLYGSWRRPPADYLRRTFFRYLRRFCLLAGVATAALAVGVLSDAALAAIRLGPISPSLAFFVPVGSIAFEIACAGALAALIRALARRVVFTAHLQQT